MIESVTGTTVAISDVVLYQQVPGGHAPFDAIEIGRMSRESDPDYSTRSRLLARNFLLTRAVPESALVALSFPMWKDAA